MKNKVKGITPGEVSRELLGSVEGDFLPWTPAPTPENMAEVARFSRPLGIEAKARHAYRAAARVAAGRGDLAKAEEWGGIAKKAGELSRKDILGWMAARIAPWPDRWEALVHAAKAMEARGLLRDAERLDGCGEAWGRIVRLFWKGAKGREVSKSYGIHRCKSRFCPSCGRAKSQERSEVIEKVLEIGSEWGLGPENVRFLTVTVRNGKSIPALRESAHKAWAKLQRRRWWGRWVAMWFRGSECITGQDGNWNFHLHVVLVLWGHRVSYSRLWDEWANAVGERSQIDIDRLHSEKMAKKRRQRGIGAAANYITKYLAKGDDLKGITAGPGGFAHYASSMKRVRAFAMGAGAPVLRRMAAILLPNWARRLEWATEGVELRRGVAPVRAEEVDPQTGEAWDTEPLPQAVDEQERAVAEALAGPLRYADPREGGAVFIGRPCGKGGRWRRLGHGPVRSSVRKVAEHEKEQPMDALHQIIANGDWRIFEEKDRLKDGRTLRYRIVLPGVRFAWKDAARALWLRLVNDPGEWAQRRRDAFQAAAKAGIGTLQRLDMNRAYRRAMDEAAAAMAPHLWNATHQREEWRRTLHPERDEQVAAWDAYISQRRENLDVHNPKRRRSTEPCDVFQW